MIDCQRFGFQNEAFQMLNFNISDWIILNKHNWKQKDSFPFPS